MGIPQWCSKEIPEAHKHPRSLGLPNGPDQGGVVHVKKINGLESRESLM